MVDFQATVVLCIAYENDNETIMLDIRLKTIAGARI